MQASCFVLFAWMPAFALLEGCLDVVIAIATGGCSP